MAIYNTDAPTNQVTPGRIPGMIQTIREFNQPINMLILNSFIQEISIKYNIDKKNIMKNYLNYIIRNIPEIVSSDFLNFVENIMHFSECKNVHFINYCLAKLLTFLNRRRFKP